MDIKNLDLNLLHTLNVLLEELNVSRAAARLSVSQSAVSHALGKLRGHFDDPLLVKARRGMTPTATAEKIKEPLRYILGQIDGLIGKGKFDPAKNTSTFRIASSDYGAGIILPRLIERLSAEAPNCKIECVPFSSPIQEDLKNGIIDLAFGGYKPFEGFFHQTVFYDRYIGVVRSNHPILKERITRKQLLQWPHAFITLPARTKRKEELYEKLGITALSDFVIQQPFYLVAPLIVERSDMVIIMPYMGAKMMARIIDVSLFELPVKIEKYPFVQTWHRRCDGDKMHRWLRHQVKEVCQKVESYYMSETEK